MTAHTTSHNVAVIGAGIGGLTAARTLAKAGVDVTVIEARDRVGGRALSVSAGKGALDLGPAWIWPGAQPQVQALIQESGLEVLEQYESGDFLFETTEGIQRGFYPARYGDARRFRRGVQAFAEALAADVPAGNLHLGDPAVGLEVNDRVTVDLSSGGVIRADALVIAVPGPVAAELVITPPLPLDLKQAMQRWPTWMAAQAKVLLVYDKPFWREAGLSGSCISHAGPLFEIADQSDPELELYALFGFMQWSAEYRNEHRHELRSSVLQQVERLFGQPATNPIDFHYQDWSLEGFTTTDADRVAPSGHPPYGDQVFEKPYFGNRIWFAGAETNRNHGGLIEGAIESGLRAAAGVLTHTRRPS